jgi:hypothetical protein|tara:strand:- start:10760 stop:11662 length:903 start_codon:yes stop_codon:yes gene_type:complete
MMSKQTLVYVKPIVRKKWHGLNELGRSKFQDTSDVLMVLYDNKIGKMATGLDTDDEIRLGSALGADLSSSSEYWDSFRIKLKDQTMIFNISIPLQELQVKLLQASKFVGNSQREIDKGKWPQAKYVIYNEAQELEKEANVVEFKAKAIELFNKLSSEKKEDLLKIYGKFVENSSRDFIYTKLFEIVDNDPIEFMKTATLTPEEIKIRALIFDLERTGILRRKNAAYLYNDQQLGFDFDNTVEVLLDPMKQELLVKLKSDLESRTPSYNNVVKEVEEEIVEKLVEKPTPKAKKKSKSKKSK